MFSVEAIVVALFSIIVQMVAAIADRSSYDDKNARHIQLATVSDRNKYQYSYVSP